MKINPDKWAYIVDLEEEVLQGGVILSEWATFITKNADTAYCNDAPLAAILTAQAGIECHLRYEYHNGDKTIRGFYDLIEKSPIRDEMKAALHELRKYRNRWVHVNDPSDDTELLDKPELIDEELERMARRAIRLLYEVLFLEQWI